MQPANGAPLRLHATELPDSLVKVKLGVVSFVGFTGLVPIAAVGATVSIVHEKTVSAPVLSAASVALTVNVCGPSARPG